MYEPGYEYIIKLDEIIISDKFRRSRIHPEKLTRKLDYYRRTGEMESRIIIDHDFVLRDGYTSYRIAQIKGIENVSVYFED